MKSNSKFLSLILRHDPSAGNLTLDSEGWADVSAVIAALKRKVDHFSEADLIRLVRDNDKQRFAFNEDGTKIRANQGHSVSVDLGLEAVTPPPLLYHGTKSQFLDSIMKEGLRPRSRQHVHLSKDIETATIVANRRSGNNIILTIDTTRLADHPFYLSDNGVWLTDHVPPEHLAIISQGD